MASNVYDMDRVEKIARITPYFSSVAEVGDEVLMGLEGDPAFPQRFSTNRPIATVTNIDAAVDGHIVTLTHQDGTKQVVNSQTIAPTEVWEFTDRTFENVLNRERMRAEQSMYNTNVAETPAYRGSNDDLMQEIRRLRNELDAEKQLTRNFHNVYIETLNELTRDVVSLESGNPTKFCKTFGTEYERMRAESSMYRGAQSVYEEEDDDDEVLSQVSEAIDELTDYF